MRPVLSWLKAITFVREKNKELIYWRDKKGWGGNAGSPLPLINH